MFSLSRPDVPYCPPQQSIAIARERFCARLIPMGAHLVWPARMIRDHHVPSFMASRQAFGIYDYAYLAFTGPIPDGFKAVSDCGTALCVRHLVLRPRRAR